jgi:putative endopeptidase
LLKKSLLLTLLGSTIAAAAPQFGTFGIDETAIDTRVSAGDDFFMYANGAWFNGATIPADQSGIGRMTALRALSDERVRTLIEDVAGKTNTPGSAANQIGTLYQDYMDEPAIERAGIAPLAPRLAAIAAIATPAELARAFGQAGREDINVPFRLFVQQDLKDNTHNGAYVRQGGLGMPNRDYYLSGDPKLTSVRGAYLQYVATLLRLAGLPDPSRAAGRIVALETALARVQWSALEERDVSKLYNPVPVAGLGIAMPGLDWHALLAASHLEHAATIIVFEPTALAEQARITASTSLATWKEYLSFHTIAAAAPYMTADFVQADFALETAISGAQTLAPRAQRGVDLVNSALGEAVGQLYVAAYVTLAARAQIDAMVRNLASAMDARLAANPWMSEPTRQQARAKLAALAFKIGHPEHWRDYTTLAIRRGDLPGNVFRARAFEYDRRRATLDGPVDRTAWSMTPQTANAYSSAVMNDVVVPAAIFQPPWFDPEADPAVNYGAVGVLIGHEMSHNFDNRGAQFDPKGRMQPWWLPEDRARFDALGARLAAQYDQYEPLPGIHVNGHLTLSENMADLAGINVAYDAYHLSLGGHEAPVLDGFGGDQRFFLGYAQVYRAKQRPQALRDLLLTDPHTPEATRLNVVRNLAAWHAAFGVRPGQAGYLAPADRITIW